MIEVNKIIQGDAFAVLKTLPDESINSVITSPPYFNLRDYSNPDVIFGGDEKCEHIWQENITAGKCWGEPNKNVAGIFKNQAENTSYFGKTKNNQCLKCSAWKGQLGLEPDYKIFINNLILIFNEAKRVLKKDGTCFVNLGDSYVGGFGYENLTDEEFKKKYPKQGSNTGTSTNKKLISEIKHANRQFSQKSLMLIPERFAIAMIDSGWILRNKLVWIKPNAMPESVQDRWKKAHEYIFFLPKVKNITLI